MSLGKVEKGPYYELTEHVMDKNFCRYSATGNTFLIFDNRSKALSGLKQNQYASWCEEHQVDGLLFLETPVETEVDFHMRYLNADGGEVEMCGNGARSILHFATQKLALVAKGSEYSFSTMNSIYKGKASELFPILMTEIKDWGLIEVADLLTSDFSYYLNTGVPHTLFEVKDLDSFDVLGNGKRIREDARFKNGANANFFSIIKENEVKMRTFERGVEGETLSCGTGATAVALALGKLKGWGPEVLVKVPGGDLTISFNEDFSKVYLSGPVDYLGEGFITNL